MSCQRFPLGFYCPPVRGTMNSHRSQWEPEGTICVGSGFWRRKTPAFAQMPSAGDEGQGQASHPHAKLRTCGFNPGPGEYPSCEGGKLSCVLQEFDFCNGSPPFTAKYNTNQVD